MPERWVGMVVSGDRVTVVDASVPQDGLIELQADITWRLQAGDRPNAYHVVSQQCINYLRENKVDKVLIKASATSRSGITLAHFHSAELRGTVQAASAAVSQVKIVSKAALSRNFGSRKVDDYTKDDHYWEVHFNGEPLRVGSREAAIMLLAERGEK
ncbi:hypothetical protein [Roseibium alexandrii]|uniref:hypothetical protein n=1 Tax=Roseibium alexandrii TaxID=388408 RepID=UPI0037528137